MPLTTLQRKVSALIEAGHATEDCRAGLEKMTETDFDKLVASCWPSHAPLNANASRTPPEPPNVFLKDSGNPAADPGLSENAASSGGRLACGVASGPNAPGQPYPITPDVFLDPKAGVK